MPSQLLYTLPGAAVEHVTRVLDNFTEYPIVIGVGEFGFVTVLHRPANDDVSVPAEHVHGPVIHAAAAKEIELLGKGSSQENKVPARPRRASI